MLDYSVRSVLMTVGVFIGGIAVGRSDINPSAIPIYVVAAIAIIAAQQTVLYRREHARSRHK